MSEFRCRIRLAPAAALSLLLFSASTFAQIIAVPVPDAQSSASSSGAAQDSTVNPATNRSDRLTVNPITGQTTAFQSNYTPLTTHERWKLYLKQSYWSVGAYFGPLFSALVLDQSVGDPKEWGGGFKGYGRRVASRIATSDIIQNGFQFPVALLLKEDVRYIASDQHTFGARAKHALAYTFLTYNSHGHATPNFANIGGYYLASGVSTLWLPEHHRPVPYALGDASEGMCLGIAVNFLQEFWPDISRHTFHRH